MVIGGLVGFERKWKGFREVYGLHYSLLYCSSCRYELCLTANADMYCLTSCADDRLFEEERAEMRRSILLYSSRSTYVIPETQ